MHRSTRIHAWLGVPVVAVLLAACGETTSPTALAPEGPRLASSLGPTLVECPVSVDSSATATIGTQGGTLALNGHRMDLPRGAVKGPKGFELKVRASNYMEVDFSAAGQTGFTFEKPVTITIDYSRCTRSNVDRDALRIYYIDPVSKAILQELGGVDDKAARTVTATTDHLSDYAIGIP